MFISMCVIKTIYVTTEKRDDFKWQKATMQVTRTLKVPAVVHEAIRSMGILKEKWTERLVQSL